MGVTGQVNVIISYGFFYHRSRHRFVNAVTKTNKHLALVDFCRVDKAIYLELNDFPVVMGSILFVASIFVIINVLVDILYGLLDPRVRI